MSTRSSAFLIYNLGCEMVFVIAQRLNSQNIPYKQAAAAIDKIISLLVDWELLTMLIKPQEIFAQESVRNIMEDIAQSSMMRLDPISMDKLWDLTTMVLKWQITLCSSTNHILTFTEKHLNEIEKYVSNPTTLDKLQRVQDCMQMLRESFTTHELVDLHRELLRWLSNFNVKVSLLIRLGLQTQDGNFTTNNTDDITKTIINNLGCNIYLTPENDKLAIAIKERKERESKLLQNDILGPEAKCENGNFKFSILNKREQEKSEDFQEIEVKRDDSNLHKLFDEFHVSDDGDNNEFDFIHVMAD